MALPERKTIRLLSGYQTGPNLTPGPSNHQPDERLEPFVVAWDEAVRMVDDGRIKDAKSMLAILLCDRLRRER